MAFQLNQKVIWIANDPNLVPMRRRIFEGTITKLGKDTVYVNGQHKLEDQIYAAFVWPDVAGPRKLCQDILEQQKRHEQEDNDIMRRTMEMNNLCIRNGLK